MKTLPILFLLYHVFTYTDSLDYEPNNKIIPSAPTLPPLVYENFPDYIQNIIAYIEKPSPRISHRRKHAKRKPSQPKRDHHTLRGLLKTETDEIQDAPKTWGMDLKSDEGYYWNDLWTNPGTEYNIGNSDSNKIEQKLETARSANAPEQHDRTEGCADKIVANEYKETLATVKEQSMENISSTQSVHDSKEEIEKLDFNNLLKNDDFWKWLQEFTSAHVKTIINRTIEEVKKELSNQKVNKNHENDDDVAPERDSSKENNSDDNKFKKNATNNIELSNKDTINEKEVKTNSSDVKCEVNFEKENTCELSTLINENTTNIDKDLNTTKDVSPNNNITDNIDQNIANTIIDNITTTNVNLTNKITQYPDIDTRINSHNGEDDNDDDDEEIGDPQTNIKAKVIYGNSIGNDKVTNIFVFYPEKPSDKVLEQLKPLLNSIESNKTILDDSFKSMNVTPRISEIDVSKEQLINRTNGDKNTEQRSSNKETLLKNISLNTGKKDVKLQDATKLNKNSTVDNSKPGKHVSNEKYQNAHENVDNSLNTDDNVEIQDSTKFYNKSTVDNIEPDKHASNEKSLDEYENIDNKNSSTNEESNVSKTENKLRKQNETEKDTKNEDANPEENNSNEKNLVETNSKTNNESKEDLFKESNSNNPIKEDNSEIQHIPKENNSKDRDLVETNSKTNNESKEILNKEFNSNNTIKEEYLENQETPKEKANKRSETELEKTVSNEKTTETNEKVSTQDNQSETKINNAENVEIEKTEKISLLD